MHSKPHAARVRRRWKPARLVLLLIVALIVAYVAYSFLFPAVVTVASAQNFMLSQNQTVFMRLYNSSVVALTLTSTSASGASFSVSSVPMVYGPVLYFNMIPSQSLSVSAFGAKEADMNVALVSSSGNGASVEITPLHELLGVQVSPNIRIANPASLTGVSRTGNVTIAPRQTSSIASTTTIAAQNSSQAEILKALSLINSTGTGTLLGQYAKLYAKGVGCNESTYNTTYLTYHGTLPPAPLSFANLSQLTPTGMTINASVSSGPNVVIMYSTTARSTTSAGPVIIAVVNTTSVSFLTSVTYTGIYQGLNYTVLNSTYAFQSRILNNCAAYVEP